MDRIFCAIIVHRLHELRRIASIGNSLRKQTGFNGVRPGSQWIECRETQPPGTMEIAPMTVNAQPFKDYSKAPHTLDGLLELEKQSKQHLEEYGQIHARITLQIANATAAAKARCNEATNRSVAERNRNVAEDVKARRKDILAAADKELWDKLRELNEDAIAASLAQDLFGSPIQILRMFMLGSERRAALFSELKTMGPAALADAAKQAIATKDKMLAAALASVVDPIRTDKRPVNIQQLADALSGDDFRRAQSAIRNIKSNAQEAINSRRELATGQPNPLNHLSMALRRRGESLPTSKV